MAIDGEGGDRNGRRRGFSRRADWRLRRHRKKGPDWIGLVELHRGLDPWQKAFLRDRWIRQVEAMRSHARKDGNRDARFRIAVTLSGVLVSSLAAISSLIPDAAFKYSTFGLGIIVAGGSAIQQIAQFGQHRLLYRIAQSRLERECCLFLWHGKGYEGELSANFSKFVTRVEEIVQDFNHGYNRTLGGQDRAGEDPEEDQTAGRRDRRYKAAGDAQPEAASDSAGNSSQEDHP